MLLARGGGGGHSYGGHQTAMLAAERPEMLAELLLLSYTLHPPGKPEQKRTAFFPAPRTPALFVRVDADPFGSLEEMSEALALIPRLWTCCQWRARATTSRAPRN
jgi:predicted alpha/beta-hydrolase family hydrolase